MNVELKYGKQGLPLTLADNLDITVIEPQACKGLSDANQALIHALQNPIQAKALADHVSNKCQVGIVFSDITRASPTKMIIPAILSQLEAVPDNQITLFCALGTHRANTNTELCEILGEQIVDRFRIVQNQFDDPQTQVCLGVSSFGHEIWINREFFECDLKILTGFIEPHFFAGYSGGGKAIMPGMAGLQTILGNHDAQMINHSNSVWGVTHGNPIWEEIHEVADRCGEIFLVNVALNKQHQISGIFCGDLRTAHQAGTQFVQDSAMVAVEDSFDIVITTNAGYPLDMNLYQAVKGMSAAAQIVKPGGTIILASECSDGIPHHGLFWELLSGATSAQALLECICSPGFSEQDQWQAQVLCKILLKSEVLVYSDFLSDMQIRACLMKPLHSISDYCTEEGRGKRICILPQGPLTIPYLA